MLVNFVKILSMEREQTEGKRYEGGVSVPLSLSLFPSLVSLALPSCLPHSTNFRFTPPSFKQERTCAPAIQNLCQVYLITALFFANANFLKGYFLRPLCEIISLMPVVYCNVDSKRWSLTPKIVGETAQLTCCILVALLCHRVRASSVYVVTFSALSLPLQIGEPHGFTHILVRSCAVCLL